MQPSAALRLVSRKHIRAACRALEIRALRLSAAVLYAARDAAHPIPRAAQASSSCSHRATARSRSAHIRYAPARSPAPSTGRPNAIYQMHGTSYGLLVKTCDHITRKALLTEMAVNAVAPPTNAWLCLRFA